MGQHLRGERAGVCDAQDAEVSAGQARAARRHDARAGRQLDERVREEAVGVAGVVLKVHLAHGQRAGLVADAEEVDALRHRQLAPLLRAPGVRVRVFRGENLGGGIGSEPRRTWMPRRMLPRMAEQRERRKGSSVGMKPARIMVAARPLFGESLGSSAPA